MEEPDMTENRFVKIDAAGGELPLDATEWEAVLDKTTGLMWSVADKKVPNWKKAAAAAKKITAAGFDDWRLPTVEELFLIADRTRTSPAIDTAFFPKCKSDWYWTSTPYASSPGVCAWSVFFGSGYAYWLVHGSYGFVRAVRAGQ
jgi:hypothetical protein